MLHRCMVVLASICLFVQLLIPTGNLAYANTPRNPSAPSTQLLTGYFTENKGQWDDSIRFVSRNDQQIIAVTLEGVWTFNPKEAVPALPLASILPKGLPTLPKALPMDAEFSPFPVSDSINIQPEGLLSHEHHYFIGNDSNRWATHCRNYTSLRIQDPSQKTDLMLSFQGEEMKLSFFAQASSFSPTNYVLDQAKLINGSDMDTGMLALNSQGHPIIAGFTSSVDFMEGEIPEDSFEILGQNLIYVLKLNPSNYEIEHATFIGGSDMNMLLGFNLNSKDQILLSGMTDSRDFPIHQPLEGMDSMAGKMMFMAGFVVMLSPDGSELTHSSYFFGPESMMTLTMSQNLDQQGQWLFYSIILGTEGFEYDHALVEESEDEETKMIASFLIQIDPETFTIQKRILASYGLTMVLAMEVSPDGYLFMSGMSMDMEAMMSIHQSLDDELDYITSYAVIVDPERKNIVSQLVLSAEKLHFAIASKWKDDTSLVGIAYEVDAETFLSLPPSRNYSKLSDEFPLPKNYFFTYQVPEQKLETFTIGSDEEGYMFGNLYFNPQGQLCVLGSLPGQENDFSLPFIEEGDLDEEEYQQAFLMVLEPDTHEILNFLSFGGPAISASVYMDFSPEGSLHILGQSAENSLYTLSPLPNDEGNSYDLKLFLLKLSPGIDDQSPPQIKLDQDLKSYTNKAEATLSGSILDQESRIKLATLNQQELSLDSEGKFSISLTLEKGSNSFLLEAWDTYNNKAELSFELIYDTQAPLIDIGKVEDFYLGTKKDPTYSFQVISSLSPVKRITVTVNDKVQYENLDSGAEVACMAPLTLQKGENKIRVTAWNMAGNQAEKEFIYWLGVARMVSLNIGSNKAQISIDGQTEEVTLDTPPIIVSGRTMVPLRFIATALGAEVTWQASDQSILIEFQGKRLTLWIGLNYAIMVEQKDGQGITHTMNLDQPPFIRGGRTMVPLRFIAEAFGAKVDFEAQTQKITFSLITLQ